MDEGGQGCLNEVWNGRGTQQEGGFPTRVFERFSTECSGVKVENPLADMISPICRQFAIYALMSPPDLGGFASMSVSSSEVMQLGGYTRILDGHL